MKKRYQKPALFAESFMTVEHISNCAENAFDLAVGFHHKENGCGIEIMNGTKVLFLQDVTGTHCDFFLPVDTITDYHGSTILTSDLFGS